eukprot:2294765-Rhodomonas_salina.1
MPSSDHPHDSLIGSDDGLITVIIVMITITIMITTAKRTPRSTAANPMILRYASRLPGQRLQWQSNPKLQTLCLKPEYTPGLNPNLKPWSSTCPQR